MKTNNILVYAIPIAENLSQEEQNLLKKENGFFLLASQLKTVYALSAFEKMFNNVQINSKSLNIRFEDEFLYIEWIANEHLNMIRKILSEHTKAIVHAPIFDAFEGEMLLKAMDILDEKLKRDNVLFSYTWCETEITININKL